MSKTMKVGLVCNFRTGAPLVRLLMQKRYIHIRGVADRDENSPGMRLAREAGLFTSSDPLDLARLGEGLDVLIYSGDDNKTLGSIKRHYTITKNSRTVIVNRHVTNLLLNIAGETGEMSPVFHPADIGLTG